MRAAGCHAGRLSATPPKRVNARDFPGPRALPAGRTGQRLRPDAPVRLRPEVPASYGRARRCGVRPGASAGPADRDPAGRTGRRHRRRHGRRRRRTHRPDASPAPSRTHNADRGTARRTDRTPRTGARPGTSAVRIRRPRCRTHRPAMRPGTPSGTGSGVSVRDRRTTGGGVRARDAAGPVRQGCGQALGLQVRPLLVRVFVCCIITGASAPCSVHCRWSRPSRWPTS